MIRQIEHHKNAFLTKRRRCIELVTALTPPRAMFAARAAAPRAPRATHASRASFARASLEKTPDFTAQKRKRVSFMPRLLDNNRAKHLTSDIQTWQRNVQRDISQRNGQGPDIGPQYRSAVFFQNEAQRETSQKLKDLLIEKGYDVATEILPAAEFYSAENYHQDYYDNKGGTPYCHAPRKLF